MKTQKQKTQQQPAYPRNLVSAKFSGDRDQSALGKLEDYSQPAYPRNLVSVRFSADRSERVGKVARSRSSTATSKHRYLGSRHNPDYKLNTHMPLHNSAHGLKNPGLGFTKTIFPKNTIDLDKALMELKQL